MSRVLDITELKFPAETVIWSPHVVSPSRIVARKIEVAAITGPVGAGTVLMLTKGSILSGTIAHSDHNTTLDGRGSETQSEVRDLSNVGIRSRIYANYESMRDGYVIWNINERCVLLHAIKPRCACDPDVFRLSGMIEIPAHHHGIWDELV